MKKLCALILCSGAVFTLAAADEAALFKQLVATKDPALALALAQGGADAVPLLVQGLERKDRVATLCAWALAQHPQPGAAPALRARLLQVDQVAAYYAARALGRMPSPENVVALASLMPDGLNGFWELSSGEVGRLRDAQDGKVRPSREPAPNVPALAASLPAGWNGFWELSSGGVGRLRDAWDTKGRRYHEPAPTNMANLRVAYSAMESLGRIGGPASAWALMRALTNDQYLIRYGAARGLGRMRHQDARQLLMSTAQNDPVLQVRRAAEHALAFLQDEKLAARVDILQTSTLWTPSDASTETRPGLPAAVAFIKTRVRSDATLGFRDSYFFPKTPRYHSGENLYTLTPPRPDGTLNNLTKLTDGEVQGPEVSFDGTRILFAMRRDKNQDGFHIFEINADGSGLRQLTDGNCNDVDPCYLPDGRIVFCSDRAGWQEYYHQERSRVLYAMNSDGTGIEQITFNPNQDYEPFVLADGRVSYSSYRFYAQDGSEGPLRGEWMGLARIETVLRSCNPDGSADQLLYGSMRGSFYVPMRPMPFSDQFAGWHRRGHHVGVSVSQQKEMPDGKIICTTPAGLTLVDPALMPIDCELPLYPEVVNLAGGEEVYIHNYDDMNPVGRYTTPYPAGAGWAWVSHAPWHDLRVNGYGLYRMNLATRELELVYDDPQMSDVDPVPLAPRPVPLARASTLKATATSTVAAGVPPSGESGVPPAPTGRIICNSVFNTDLPFDQSAVRYVRVLEGVQMGQSIAANAAFRTRLLGTTPVHPDGSFNIEVPADVPLRFELLDEDGRMLVHETEFNSVRPGETKGCVGCHENRRETSPNLRPLALEHPPAQALRQDGDLIYMGQKLRPYNRVYRD